MKNITKLTLSIFSFLASVILCLTFVNDVSAKASSKFSESFKFFNNTEEGPGYRIERGQTYGTDGFTIVNGKPYLLDTLNCSIITTDGNSESKYCLEGTKYPVDVIYNNEHFYVLDMWGSECTILTYDSCFKLESISKTVHMDPYTMEITSDGKVMLLGENKAMALKGEDLISVGAGVKTSRKDNSTITLSIDDYTWNINAGLNSFIKYVSHKDDILYYERCQIVDGCSELIGELSLECINLSGNLVSYMRIEKNQDSHIPFVYFKQIDGISYYLSVSEAETILSTVSLDSKIDSKFEECLKKAEESKEAVNNLENTRQMTYYANVTRSQAFTRAMNIINTGTTWQLKYQNTVIPSAYQSYITLPDYILAIKNSGALDNGGYSMQVGTPYCWGGFDSIYTSNNPGYSTFSAAINAGYVAGNVSSAYSYKVPGTAGLDCSGFVSAVYAFTSKQGTGALASNLNSVSSTSNLASMDCLVYSGYHALLFSSWVNQSTGQFVLCESNNPSDYDDRAATRTKYISNYVGNGYSMKTGW